MSKLYIVATPIGNLEDITNRALRILTEVDVILCEDTRHTLQLLNHFEIKKKLISYHQHSKIQKIEQIINLLKEGKDLALVSDAGTPALSDPGGVLVSEVHNQLGNQVEIIPIPGVAALTTLISVSGIPSDKFEFLGFLPHKKGRQTLFKKIAESKTTIYFYESPHRIMKTIDALVEVLDNDRQVVIGRELTKKFETIYRGNIKEVKQALEDDEVKGEFVVGVKGK
ncbi:MAG: 16S rRNA (cytidine(1402)-2'-O)-methyltransferase [bacterium]|nr:16S rRNA (cytidine(1402)-2'-O)-methyltransferase [bacterium]